MQKLRMPAAVERIKDDVAELFEFLSTLKPAKELESYFEVVEMVLSLLEASKSLAFLSFWNFAKVHGSNLAFVEGLMKARGDLDRSSVNEVMDSIKRKAKEENLTDRKCFPAGLISPWLIVLFLAPEPTIMKKVTVEGTFSRLLRTGKA
jgi:exocyst complex component 3